MSEFTEIPKALPTKEVKLKELPQGIARTTEIATWLGLGKKLDIRLTSGGIAGLERTQLKAIEDQTPRTTITDHDPPLFLKFARSANGSQAETQLTRWSQTKQTWDLIFYLNGNLITQQAQLFAGSHPETTMQAVTPIFDQIGQKRRELTSHAIKDKPNSLLMRTYFATGPDNAYWVGLESPLAKKLNQDPNLYRVYLHPQIQSIPDYTTLAPSVTELVREYTKDPLNFKLIYSGDGAPGVILEPNSTKIVFYFNQRDSALNFADWFTSLPDIQKLTPGQSPETFHAQRQWLNGLVLLGKSSKEDRQEVKAQLKNPYSNKEHFQKRAQELELSF